ncbi:MAG: hypothetical protein HC845_11105 [Akkermansiaceae bacterium]|nr:hypothetical protein [Akkermansiaceae bacterium]
MEITKVAYQLEGIGKSREKQSEAYQKLWADLITQFNNLNAPQLAMVIAELGKLTGISRENQREIIGLAIVQLAEKNVSSALSVLEEHADLLGKGELATSVISSSLSKLAEQNPQSSLAWVRKNGGKYSQFDRAEIYNEIIASTAKNDSKQALIILGELKLEQTAEAYNAIVEVGDSPEKRTNILSALREHIASLSEADRQSVRDDAFAAIAQNLDSEGIDAMTSWISKSKFSPEEKQLFANGLNYFATRQDTGRWVEWLGENLPADQLSEPITELVGEWTEQDYQAAGTWLAAAPESPAKHSAVLAYAKAIAVYEPQVANQWAQTLPPGPIRDETLKLIYRNWPSNDPQGAAAFAAEHKMN